MKRKFLWLPGLCALLLCICLPAGFAQIVTGSISGQVTDPSGAVIPGAQVIAHDLDTGVATQTVTNGDGFYRIASLPPGHYDVSVEAAGFQKALLPAFTLEVLQSPVFNVTMQVGSASTTVNVSAAAPILNTTNPTLSSTFTANTISNFPLNGQDFSAITLYMPGAIDTAGTSGPNMIERSTYFTDTPNMNGNRAQANNYTLDGIDMNETFNNLISYSPSPQALQEIKVLTANSPAEYGNVNGGDVVSVLKSGTNHFHGSAYGFVQDYRMNANSWQNNHANPIIKISPFSQSQFGGTLGGPILRDKLFFFFDYLGTRYHTGGIGQASVFTQAMRNGDFSALLSGSSPIQLYDSENNFAPYAGNKGIPVINPVAKYLFANSSIYPLPNATPSDGIAANNFQGPTRSYKANNQGDIKLEYDPRNNDKITGFYSMGTAYDGSRPVLAVSFPGVNNYPTKLFGVNWVHTFSPQWLNNAKIGFTRTVWAQNFPIDITGVFGNSGDAKVGIPFPNQSFAGFTYQQIAGGINGGGNPAYGGGLIDNTYSYIDDVTWQHGLHTVTMGIQALRYQNNYPTANNYGYLGILNYSGDFTSNPAVQSAVGYGGADFLLDRVTSASATLRSVNVGQRQWRAAEYISDEYRIRPNLTVNVGVRYEYDEPWVEENNKTGNVDLATGQILYAHQVPVGAPPGSGVCNNRGCYQPNFHQIMPRLGFEYQPLTWFVVRGGYGATSFFEGNSSNQRLTSITPFIQAVNVNAITPTSTNPGTPRRAEDGFQSSASSIVYGGTFNVYPQNIQPAYIQEWNLTTEYALNSTTSLQVGYIGEQGQHIEDYGNVNQWRVPGDATSAPFYNSPYIGVNSPNPATAIGSQPLLITESRAMMNFNAMESTLRQRLHNGLEYTVNYTYSKAMTNSLGNYGLVVNGYSGAFENYYNSGADYGPAGYDATHNLSFTGVYALPVGRGALFLNSVNRAVDEAIGGWKLSAVGAFWSGFPETIYGPGNNSQSFGTSRVNQYRKLKIVHRTLTNWLGDDPSATDVCPAGVDDGVCAFGIPASNTFGTSRNGVIRAPGFRNVDLSAFKDFNIVENQTIGFRFDAFNALNIVSYGNPDTGVTDSTYGQILPTESIRSNPRTLQFSAHYNF